MSNDCWKKIGVTGDRSCPELKKVIHCHNCPIYAAAGRNLLERTAPTGYVNTWTNLLSRDKDIEITYRVASADTISVGIFRIGAEWLALPAKLFKEVTENAVIHILPQRSNEVLLGLVNVRGEIQLCISLQALLGIETAVVNSQNINPLVYGRMVVIEKAGSRWVFPVDEIYGIHRIYGNELGNVPATVNKIADNYTKGMIKWQSQNVSYLDDELLFYTLDKKLL